ncbi:hypothetical protein GGI04_002872 [Coemansia thaxteri]|uniref:Uncharacterized protein n=1 Tax=Coemansia thaxteri TaxID=2663907 RepID=A0A9W8BP11_9FUNG|nr:hypothetical protein GGI04_002872 [Coemansia thaxteri]KAJ2008244.1 hypothetical protein H4R26_000278 [Coemansia thaxteri]KAJ2470670.1 hypothetical protein GGI02_002772 [Coemansia sp. RSA 2322]KAJ2485287.1 hypothetical protein EV174_001837 [Coemansia sp. RSA 2320]
MDSSDDTAAFQAFETYDFAQDAVFQAGLLSIPNHKEDDRVLEQAKAFYYSRMVSPIDYAKYQAWKQAGSHVTEKHASDPPSLPPDAPYSASFAEVVGMIMRGETVPGIREIPDKLNDCQPSTSSSTAPRKPWEEQSK